jgi:hypothetical protein
METKVSLLFLYVLVMEMQIVKIYVRDKIHPYGHISSCNVTPLSFTKSWSLFSVNRAKAFRGSASLNKMSKKTFEQAGNTTLHLNTAVNYNSKTTQRYREDHDSHITVISDYRLQCTRSAAC